MWAGVGGENCRPAALGGAPQRLPTGRDGFDQRVDELRGMGGQSRGHRLVPGPSAANQNRHVQQVREPGGDPLLDWRLSECRRNRFGTAAARVRIAPPM
jgi:hypothetical protein